MLAAPWLAINLCLPAAPRQNGCPVNAASMFRGAESGWAQPCYHWLVPSQSMQTSESSKLAPRLTMLTIAIDKANFLLTAATAGGGRLWMCCPPLVAGGTGWPLNDRRSKQVNKADRDRPGRERAGTRAPAGRRLRGNSPASLPLLSGSN